MALLTSRWQTLVCVTCWARPPPPCTTVLLMLVGQPATWLLRFWEEMILTSPPRLICGAWELSSPTSLTTGIISSGEKGTCSTGEENIVPWGDSSYILFTISSYLCSVLTNRADQLLNMFSRISLTIQRGEGSFRICIFIWFVYYVTYNLFLTEAEVLFLKKYINWSKQIIAFI